MGFPSPAMDYMEDRIDLNKELMPHPLSTFIFKYEGDAMINAFIPPRALLLVDRSVTAKTGDIVLAVIDGEYTVRYLQKNDFKCKLIAANRKYKDIEVTFEMNMTVWGVVTAVISKPNELKCML